MALHLCKTEWTHSARKTAVQFLPLIALPQTGTYSVSVQALSQNYNPTTIVNIQNPTPISIDGDSVQVHIDGSGWRKLLSFEVTQPQRLGLAAIIPIDPPTGGHYHAKSASVTIYSPTGAELAQNLSCRSFHDATIPIGYVDQGCGFDLGDVADTGKYTILIHSYMYGIDPKLTLSSTKRVTSAVDGPGASLVLRRAQPGQIEFAGSEGQTVQVHRSIASNLVYPMKLIGPGGQILTTIDTNPQAGSSDLPTLPEDGIYVLEESIDPPFEIPDYETSIDLSIETLQSCAERAGPVATGLALQSVVPNPTQVGLEFVASVDVFPAFDLCGSPVGTVEIHDAWESQYSCTFDTDVANGCALVAPTTGMRHLVATFTPADATLFAGSSTTFENAVNVQRNPVIVTVASVTPEPSTLGQTYTVQINVEPVNELPFVPTRWAQVYVDGSFRCYAMLPEGRCDLVGNEVADVLVTATYPGDSHFLSATSEAVIHSIIAAEPHIATVTPAIGTVGTSVTLAGQNFGATPSENTVDFNGVVAPITSASATQLVTTVPEGATTGPVHVATHGEMAISSQNFTVVPIISGLSPASGVVGTVVTIAGSGFDMRSTTVNQVQFSGTDALVTYASPTQLKATLPSGATTGPVTLVVGGQSAASPSPFTVEQLGTGAASVVITGVSAEPSLLDNAYSISADVSAVDPSTPAPGGTVTIDDGTHACAFALPATSCSLTGQIVGQVALTAHYSGDATFAATHSDSVGHIVNPVEATEICGFDPWAIPKDPPGFVPVNELSGAMLTPGLAHDINGVESLGVTIVEPVATSTTSNPVVDVIGTFEGPVNTGFRINGIVGATYGGWFLVPNVPLATGLNTLTVVATTLPGASTTASVSVTRVGAAPLLELRIRPTTGFAPLTARLDAVLKTLPNDADVQSAALDFDGDGVFETTASTLAELPGALNFSRPGLYSVGIQVTDTNNMVYTSVRNVLVQDLGAQRVMLCDVYGYLKDRLRQQDVAGAAAAFHPSAAERLTPLFDALDTDMPNAASMLGTIVHGYLGKDFAELMLVRDNEDQTRSGFPLRLTRGSDGVWRITEL